MAILYLEDWQKYPNATYDLTTTNTSFLDLVETYYRQGVKNHLFPLAIYQRELIGVDPFSPDLTFEQIVKISQEVKYNPWYFFREVARVKQAGSSIPSKWLANRGNIAFVWSFLNGFDFANIMPRQCGKSVGADSINNYVVHLAAEETNVQLFTHSRGLRAENIKRLKGIRDLLPPYLRYYQEGVDADNTEMITCKKLKNFYLTAVSTADKDQAELAGRGFTAPIVDVDEFPFCHNVHISFPVMIGSMATARDIARANGTFNGLLITTTAGSTLTEEGNYAYNVIHDGMAWNENLLLDASCKEEAIEVIKRHSRNKDIIMINGTFSAMQVGKSRQWLKDKIANARGSRDSARQDYLNEWVASDESAALAPEYQEILRTAVKEPVRIEASRRLYSLNWFVPKEQVDVVMNNGFFVMTLDTGNLAGSDANGLTIQELSTMEVVATSEINEASLYDYGQWIADLLIQYPRITLIMEHKSSATGIFDAIAGRLILKGIDPFRRIFNRVVDDTINKQHEVILQNILNGETARSLSYYQSYKSKFGFMTTGKSRAFLYGSVLNSAIETCAHKVVDKSISEQLRLLKYINGRIDHPKGGHDDMAISWLFGHWFVLYARNLSWYGIPAGYAYSKVAERGATMTEEEIFRQEEAQEVKNAIAKLKKDIADCSNPIREDMLVMQLQQFMRRLEALGSTAMTMDSLLQEIAEMRAGKANLRNAVQGAKQNSGWYS